MKKSHAFLKLASAVLLLGMAMNVSADNSAAGKFGRGLAGMACGFLEIPGNIVKETTKSGAIGVPIGLAMGLGMFVTRELVGTYEFVTAPFPLPAGFKPILSPEYPWDYF